MRRKKQSKLLALLLGLLLTAALAGPAAAEEVVWRMQSLYGAMDTSTTIQAQGLVDALNEKLKGTLQVKLFMPGQIVPEEEMFDALGKGVYDAAMFSFSWTIGSIPEAAVAFGLPFSWQNVDQVFEFFYDKGFLDWMRQLHAEKNVHLVAPMPFGPIQLMTKFPVHKIDDLKGKKFWSIGPTSGFVKQAGAVPVLFPPPDMYMALKLGTVDGVIFSAAELEGLKLKEVVKYLVNPGFIDPLVLSFIVSQDSWDKLTPEAQKTIEDTVREINPGIFQKLQVATVEGIEAAKKVGVEVVDLDEMEVGKMRELAVKVWAETAAKSDRTAKTVGMLKEYLTSKGIKVDY
ncbi:MAG: TRAP transporter substrate-binding protein DctP [Thermodesulfobacteriota bacterium]